MTSIKAVDDKDSTLFSPPADVTVDEKPVTSFDLASPGSDGDHDEHLEKGHGGHEEDRTGSSMSAFFNIVCVVAGSGILQLPVTFSQAGWIGVLCVVLAALFSFFTGHLLIRCLYYKDGQRLGTYPDVGMASFGRIGKIVVLILHYSICLGSACVYINIAGTGVEPLLRNIGVDVSPQVWCIIAAILICLPFVLFKSMKEVTLLGLFGALTTVVMVVVVVVVGLIDMPNQVDVTHMVVDWGMVPAAMGSICFSFGGNVVYPHVESTMRRPQSWTKVLGMATVAILTMYLLVAIVGYQVYGDQVKSPIYDSLPTNAATTVAILMLAAHVILAAPMMLTTFALEIEENFHITTAYMSKSREFITRAIFRTATVVVITIPAMFLPVKSLMALVGSLSNSLIIYALPVVCYWRLFGIRSMNVAWLVLSGLCIVTAVMACIFGTIDAIKDIIKVFS
ncbi:hypothetical protein H4R34_003227 [Dimargaris verticillata]|uniref:Amino acid transporter transmembrane domain-containing protein n=1 Tax=Dimargaris verticillata TaxID=2761393 RepID=A0A9W8EDC5_9FUNG|nr:hypothetical protein H4R34_003227 [Dimargaris verticillata]